MLSQCFHIFFCCFLFILFRSCFTFVTFVIFSLFSWSFRLKISLPFYLVCCRISYTENHRFSQLFNQRVCERLNWSQPAAPVTFLPHLPPPRWPQCLMLYHVLSHVRIGCWSRCAIPTSLCVHLCSGPRGGEMLRKRVHAKGRRCLTTPKIWLCVRVPFRFRGLCVCVCVCLAGRWIN